MNNITSSMPALSRIKTVTYSKESKKCPGYAFDICSQKQVRTCNKTKIEYIPSVQPIVNPPTIKNDIILFGGFPYSFGLFLNGGTPISNGNLINCGSP